MNKLLDRRRSMGTSMHGYIRFNDKVVERICAITWGDGKGLTYEQAAAVSELGNVFYGNKDIVSFHELRYFTGLEVLTQQAFRNSSLASCTVGCKIIDYSAFQSSDLTEIRLLEGVEQINGNAFNNARLLSTLVLPSTVRAIGRGCFANMYGLSTLIARPITPPTITGEQAFVGTSAAIYVPYSEDHSFLSAYKNSQYWSDVESRIHELDPNGIVPNN